MRCRYVLLMVLWVLWSELLGDGKPEWNSIDTFNTQAACTEESQQRASRAKQNRKVLNSGPTYFTYRSPNSAKCGNACRVGPSPKQKRGGLGVNERSFPSAHRAASRKVRGTDADGASLARTYANEGSKIGHL